MTGDAWRVKRGDDPIVVTAIHAGHEVRPEVGALMKLADEGRRREEDPYTDLWTDVAANSVIVDRSRFEVDLNRPRDWAVYLVTADAWGLDVWTTQPSEEVKSRSLEIYDRFYEEFGALCDEVVEQHGHVVVLDLHSYNHRRNGPNAPVDDPDLNPEINLGTESIDPAWDTLVCGFHDAMSEASFFDGTLDVRANIKFRGGQLTRWTNERYGPRGLSIAVEMKKIYMDEWTGVIDTEITSAIGQIIESATHFARESLRHRG